MKNLIKNRVFVAAVSSLVGAALVDFVGADTQLVAKYETLVLAVIGAVWWGSSIKKGGNK